MKLHMCWLWVVWVIVAGAFSVRPCEAAQYALLVGIDKYENPNISQLEFATADVKAVGTTLQRQLKFTTVKIMTSDVPRDNKLYPSSENVLMQLDLLANKVQPEDTFLFYFSGHGYQKTEGHFLGTANANPFNIITLKKSTLSLDDLKEALQRIKARQLIFILDACRIDPSKGRGGVPNRMTASFARDFQLVAREAGRGQAGTATLLACSQGERAWEWPERGHGVFTYYLLQGLKGAAAEGNGAITAYSLCTYVQDKVRDWSQENRPAEEQQTPDFQLAGAARIIIGKAGNGLRIGSTKSNPIDGADMVWVPAGEFLMGSTAADAARVKAIQQATGLGFSEEWMDDQQPQRRVYLDGYWMYKHEVTVGQYRKFCDATERAMPQEPNWGWKDDHPIVNVSWEDADAYGQWAGVQLPTEAQWEKAARGGDGRLYPWGNNWDASRAQVSRKEPGDVGSTAPVGNHPGDQSVYGAMDMAGNVYEWCSDWYEHDYYRAGPQRNPKGALTGEARVCRSGSWSDTHPSFALACNRLYIQPTTKVTNLGFRCVEGL